MTEPVPYGFDPSVIIKVVLQNKDLGLALVQIPLQMLNDWIGGDRELSWEDRPKFPGYYWTKDSNDLVSIVYISPEKLTLPPRRVQYAGPLIPPK